MTPSTSYNLSSYLLLFVLVLVLRPAQLVDSLFVSPPTTSRQPWHARQSPGACARSSLTSHGVSSSFGWCGNGEQRHFALCPVLWSTAATSSNTDFVDPIAADATINAMKAKLVQVCGSSAVTKDRVQNLVRDLEEAAETMGIGQASAVSGLLPGQWELIYSSEDDTRSSPFFWAFRQAFPEQSDQIFGITDAIPASLKEVGPASQTIEFSATTRTGSLVSRVKVATLGGAATSIMTTRATITGTEGVDGIRLQIDTTKPEDSTILRAFGPLGSILNENVPAFPSGQALEQVQPGASQVIMRTSFCDEGLRISRNDGRPDDFYIWRRTDFAISDVM